jgi:hypothetical protein
VFGLAFLAFTCSSGQKPSTIPLSDKTPEIAQPNEVSVRTGDAYAKASADHRCSERYPTDFSMQAACGRNAESGREDFIDIWNRHLSNPAMNIALQGCFGRYTESGFTDFSMAGACARNQEDGLADVNR